MKNLLSSQALRLRKSWLLWLALILTAAVSLMQLFSMKPSAGELRFPSTAESALRNAESILYLISTNFLIVADLLILWDARSRRAELSGYARHTRYLAMLTTLVAVNTLLWLCAMVPVTVGSLFLYDRSQTLALLRYSVGLLLGNWSLASLFTMMGAMINRNGKMLAFTIPLLAVSFLIIWLYGHGLIFPVSDDPNALYAMFQFPYRGAERVLAKHAVAILPFGQGYPLPAESVELPLRLVGGLFSIAMTTGLGLLVFGRKKLR